MFPANPNSSRIIPSPVQDESLPPASSTVVFPLIDEQVQVRKEWVETGRVRVNKQVHEETQTINIPLMHEVVDVERVPVNRVVSEVPLSRQEGDTLVLPVVREEVVTSIRLVLVEEVRITRRQQHTTDQQSVTTRHETVSIDRIEPDQSAKPDSAATFL
ncbi:YsnF/AvaK domain-containing protein [uncultured Fibrella sp.]|uniref:YsnF/AvaK domain-containing protein n=1 Tax=uncultured Fibrella sp. TaxID=1284596 RepID=UPI0035CAE5F4